MPSGCIRIYVVHFILYTIKHKYNDNYIHKCWAMGTHIKTISSSSNASKTKVAYTCTLTKNVIF